MNVNSILFNQNKYVKATDGNRSLIAITYGSLIASHDFNTNTTESINYHTPCLAYAVLEEHPNNGYSGTAPIYHIKSFVGDVFINATPTKLNDRLNSSTDLYCFVSEIVKIDN